MFYYYDRQIQILFAKQEDDYYLIKCEGVIKISERKFKCYIPLEISDTILSNAQKTKLKKDVIEFGIIFNELYSNGLEQNKLLTQKEAYDKTGALLYYQKQIICLMYSIFDKTYCFTESFFIDRKAFMFKNSNEAVHFFIEKTVSVLPLREKDMNLFLKVCFDILSFPSFQTLLTKDNLILKDELNHSNSNIYKECFDIVLDNIRMTNVYIYRHDPIYSRIYSYIPNYLSETNNHAPRPATTPRLPRPVMSFYNSNQN